MHVRPRVVLAGGLGSRLLPLTKVTNKHLLPVYDQPMVFYPMQTLIKAGIDEILIAIPSATGSHIRKIVERCEALKVRFKILPAVGDLIAGRVSIRQFREVQIEDLLGREHIQLDVQRVGGEIAGSTVLITGAAGSIGSELCHQISRLAYCHSASAPVAPLRRLAQMNSILPVHSWSSFSHCARFSSSRGGSWPAIGITLVMFTHWSPIRSTHFIRCRRAEISRRSPARYTDRASSAASGARSTPA